MRAYVAIALLAMLVVADGAGVLSMIAQHDLLARAAEGAPPTMIEAKAHDARYAAINRIQVVAFLSCCVGWLVWQHRAYSNLRRMGTGVTDHSPGRATAWWFVPVMNLVRPFQVVKELWLRSASGNAPSEYNRGGAMAVSLWWAAWLLSIAVGRIATRWVPLREGLQGLQTETTLALVFHGLNIIAAMVAMNVVWRIHRLQTRPSALLATADARSVPAE